MKHSGLLMIMAAFLFLASCADKPSRPDTILTEAQKTAADAAATAAANAGIQSAAVSGVDLPHYYCANSCEGSGSGSPGSCPTCGNAYTHNDAFHNKAPTPQPAGTMTAPPVSGQTLTSPVTMGGDNVISTPVTPTKAPEPPQNANGVWHYTCSAGCAGGAGGAGTCASCGGPLAHNTAYHN